MPIDSREFRNALGTFPTGVTVVTTGTAPNFVGMTAQSFSSLSLDPPLVLICVDKKASVRSLLQETSAFTVNVLNEDQEETSTYFASSDRPGPPEQFEDVHYTIGETGTPRLAHATTVFDCSVREVLEGGDHEIFIGEVKAFEHQNDNDPILFFRGRYRTLDRPTEL